MDTNFTVELFNSRDLEACYKEYGNDGQKREINFDYKFESNSVFGKKILYLFPDSFTNWSDGNKEQLSVYHYVLVLKRIIKHFEGEFDNYQIKLKT